MAKERLMRVIIAGGRDFQKQEWLERSLTRVMANQLTKYDLPFTMLEIVVGGAKGVDQMVEEWANKNQLKVVRFDADWEKDGKTAGMIRDTEMSKYARAALHPLLIAVWDGSSKGTLNMIQTATKYGIYSMILPYRNQTKGGG